MNSFRSIGVTLLALSMGIGGYASAQDRGPPDRGDRHAERRGPPDRNDRGHWDNRGGRPGNDAAHYNNRGEWRGAGPNHDFRRGSRLPPQYRSRQYVVNDWRGHHLSAPPRGYHWVQTGSDYVLAAVATGVILQILLNN